MDPHRPTGIEAARAAGRAEAEDIFAEHKRAQAARLQAGRQRYQDQQDARRRLAQRYGSDREKDWSADPNGPLVDPTRLLHAFLNKAGPASLQSSEMEQAPALDRADALAAAHMIAVARRDAQRLEVTVMRQVLAHGVTWDELADALDTSVEKLRQSVRRHGERPETWTVPVGETE
ncbi:hypothetical protein [Amycolatopsis magusensis]|uniref:hypothetical protein n=1 Tax=Amycolatopsis magusensis TaxID=882444 RepID=UPI0037883EB9